jgi:methionyl aminopeptidase
LLSYVLSKIVCVHRWIWDNQILKLTSTNMLHTRCATRSSLTLKRFYSSINETHPLFTPRIIRKGKVSPTLFVPDHIQKPPYYDSKVGDYHKIDIKNEEQIQGMRQACKLARKTLEHALKTTQVGVTTNDIDQTVHEFIISHGAYPSPLFYNSFQKSVCTSVNEVMVHGIPDDTILHDGDIINIDVTVYYNGYHGDCSETIMVGEGNSIDSVKRQRMLELIDTAREATYIGIRECGPDKPFHAIGGAIEEYVQSRGLTIARDFCGHGIGSYFHGYPQIMHHKSKGYHPATVTGIMKRSSPKQKMQPGMTFTIEPVVNGGTGDFKMWKDEWTIVTKDRCVSATWEHTLLITESGVEIMTANENEKNQITQQR